MNTYRVEFRKWEPDDVYTIEEVVQADSAHEAIGKAWYEIQYNVEQYGGTIDDLEASIVEPENDRTWVVRLRVAKELHASMMDKHLDTWYPLPIPEKEKYLQAADAAIERAK